MELTSIRLCVLPGLQFVESAAYTETLKAARAIDQDAVSIPPSSLKVHYLWHCPAVRLKTGVLVVQTSCSFVNAQQLFKNYPRAFVLFTGLSWVVVW
jgi:hypothetical protein